MEGKHTEGEINPAIESGGTAKPPADPPSRTGRENSSEETHCTVNGTTTHSWNRTGNERTQTTWRTQGEGNKNQQLNITVKPKANAKAKPKSTAKPFTTQQQHPESSLSNPNDASDETEPPNKKSKNCQLKNKKEEESVLYKIWSARNGP